MRWMCVCFAYVIDTYENSRSLEVRQKAMLNSRNPGRPQYNILHDQIMHCLSLGMTSQQIAICFGVNRRTLYRHRQQLNIGPLNIPQYPMKAWLALLGRFFKLPLMQWKGTFCELLDHGTTLACETLLTTSGPCWMGLPSSPDNQKVKLQCSSSQSNMVTFFYFLSNFNSIIYSTHFVVSVYLLDTEIIT